MMQKDMPEFRNMPSKEELEHWEKVTPKYRTTLKGEFVQPDAAYADRRDTVCSLLEAQSQTIHALDDAVAQLASQLTPLIGNVLPEDEPKAVSRPSMPPISYQIAMNTDRLHILANTISNIRYAIERNL